MVVYEQLCSSVCSKMHSKQMVIDLFMLKPNNVPYTDLRVCVTV
jgi:hypothetical protein